MRFQKSIKLISATGLLTFVVLAAGCADRSVQTAVASGDPNGAQSNNLRQQPRGATGDKNANSNAADGEDKERYVLPVDEGKDDASFSAFRAALLKAIDRKDAKFILSQIDPQIKIGFSGADGIQNFKKHWKINDPNTRLWKEMKAVLGNGGAFQDKTRTTFWAPYTYKPFPDEATADVEDVIFGKDVDLHAQPAPDSPVVAKLAYNVVRADYENSKFTETPDGEREYSWVKVETLGGKKGFVRGEFVRNSLDYRMACEKTRGKWKIAFFVSGD